ncbi:MAG TPA: PGPGW domain-containing protein [Rubrobacter sp.]
MLERMKQHWQEFKESNPGQRFKDRYRRRQQEEQGHIIWRTFLVALGAVIAVGSFVLAPLPGPGWATVFIGLMILAGELLPVARFLDWLEVQLRDLWRITRKVWKSSALGKVAVVMVAVALAAAVVYVAYLLLFSGSLF